MSRFRWIPALFVLLFLLPLSSFAQERPLVGTVIDVDAGNGRLQVESDDDSTSRITIETDSVATTWHGFGSMIAGKPEIFTGSAGFANVRLGDRVEIRGSLRSEGVFHAAQVRLLGRQVAAPQVGVGQTRTPTSVATPTEEQARAADVTTIEGTIRQINAEEGRLVIQTPQRKIITITAHRTTPVWYRGEEYRVANLEAGDRIRVEIDPRDAQAAEMVARRIDVTQGVQDSGTGNAATVTTINGRAVRIEPGLDYAYVNDGRSEIRVDMSRAEDASGATVRSRDLRVGDQVEISGSYSRAGDIFLASTIRFASGRGSLPAGGEFPRYVVVTVTGTVVETLDDAPTIAVRDRDSSQVIRVRAVDDLAVRTRTNSWTTADQLRVDDVVAVQAFRDQGGTFIAQTIRLRNR